MEVLLYSSVILIGAALLLFQSAAKWGHLIAGLGFILLGFYIYKKENAPLFLIFGLVIAALAVYRFFRPYTPKSKNK